MAFLVLSQWNDVASCCIFATVKTITMENVRTIAVIGASAIDLSGDLLDFDPEEVRVSQQVIKAARATILVADATKFTRKAPVKIASLAQVDHFVTDRIPSEQLVTNCVDWGTQLHRV